MNNVIRIYYFTMGFLAGILGTSLTGCGPHQGANVDYAVDCIDGCSEPYQEKVAKYRGEAGADGTDSVSTSTVVVRETVVITQEPIVGPAGRDGEDGTDGSSCTTIQIANGAMISCTDGTYSYVYDGEDGQDGESPLVDVLDPCGEETQFDEVILVFELSDEEVLYIAYFTEGGSANKARLAVLDEGTTYQTTDGTQCTFSIVDGQLVD